MNCLRLSSLLLLAFCSCTPYRNLPEFKSDSKCLSLLTPSDETLLYHTQIDFYKKHFSGLLLLKTIEGKRRAVFTNEMGITFFDFEFAKNRYFKVIKIANELNHKPIISTLRRDISMLLLYFPENSCCTFLDNDSLIVMKEKSEANRSNCYIAAKDCSRLVGIEHYKLGRKKIEADFFDSGEMRADSIAIDHHGIKLCMYFKRIER